MTPVTCCRCSGRPRECSTRSASSSGSGDPHAGELTPALSHGYSARVLAQLPRVRRDTDNATAAAFRSAQTSVVNGSDQASGAVVVPLIAPAGCVGVLAIELPIGSAQSESARALVTIFAAQLARLIGHPACDRGCPTGRRISHRFRRRHTQRPMSLPPPPRSRASSPAIRIDRSWVAILLIATISGLAAFALVRSLVAPPHAATSLPATLTVSTQPAGADLFIDGQRRGPTPLTLSIEPGAHTLTLRSAGTERIVPITVTAGAQVAQHFELKPPGPLSPSARLSIVRIRLAPGSALTDVRAACRPWWSRSLAAAEYSVTVTSNTGSAERRITVEAGTSKEVVFSLPRSSAPLGGWVSVVSPFEVDVLEHDEVVGTSGVTKVMLPAGRHEVVLRNERVGYEERRSVDVVAGSVSTMTVVPPNAPLNVNARPWAEVAIDGTPAGQTPLGNVMIAVGDARDHVPSSAAWRTHADGRGDRQGGEPRCRRFDQMKVRARCR